MSAGGPHAVSRALELANALATSAEGEEALLASETARLTRERDEARAEVERLRGEVDVLVRELHRISCGIPIESDGLCPYGIAEAAEKHRAMKAEEEVERLRDVLYLAGRLAQAVQAMDSARGATSVGAAMVLAVGRCHEYDRAVMQHLGSEEDRRG